MLARVLMCAVLTCSLFAAPAARAGDEARPNIVVILTDDQRWDTLWAMPTVESELAGKGVTFTKAFVVNPLCCPSRASILTGQYSHSTGIYRNDPPHGGFEMFDDRSTIATWLDDAGYQTMLVGKYLNAYGDEDYKPPGWDVWNAWLTAPPTHIYYDYRLTSEGGPVSYGTAPEDYSTDVFATKAVDFINGADPANPLFLYFPVNAPHDTGRDLPPSPAPRHFGAFDDLEPFRPPSYNEANMNDKPSNIRNQPLMRAADSANMDLVRRRQLESLLAVDDAVGSILQALADTGRLENTMIVFTSDNGFFWGEHRKSGKVLAYEESIRVPYIVRYDPLTGGSPSSSDDLVLNIDLAPTFAELAGTDAPRVEGESLLPILGDDAAEWRSQFLVEGIANRVSYCALRKVGRIYIYWANREDEYYDLTDDPYEMKSVADKPGIASKIPRMRRRLAELCHPAPPGMKIPHTWRS